MARTQQQIADSIKTSLLAVDNRLDLKVGPLWDYLISPIPPELASIESTIDTLLVYYSPNFANVATPTQARDFAVNFGTGPSIGGFASTTVTFYRNSPPPTGLTFVVPVGALVQTIDGTLVYSVTQQVTMSGDYASTYFNPTSNHYEVQASVQAVSPGVTYNIPANHISKMQTTISGFDGVQQPYAASGGTDPEDSVSVALRVQNSFKGLEHNSISGLKTTIQEAQSSYVTAVNIVKPTDRVEFRRLTNGPSLDVYVLGQNYTQCTEDYLAVGGEVTIPITVNKTMIGITSVSVNGNILDATAWKFLPDTTLAYQFSTRANPVIQLTSALSSNDLVEIIGTKNYLLDSLQVLFTGENSLFYTDILIRSFIQLPIVVSLDIRITSGDTDTINSEVVAFTTAYIQPTSGIPSQLTYGNLISLLQSSIPEIDTIKVLEFRREFNSINMVETIVPYKNQVPIFDYVASSIIVRS
jgi:hypothetical protein